MIPEADFVLPATGFRALVIDDDDTSRHVAAAILKRFGAREVIEAASGADALDWADRDQSGLDLVMCDLRMPQYDGLDTLAGLTMRVRPSVVVLASAADPRLLRAAAGMAARSGIERLHTISKPITPEKIRDVVSLLSNTAVSTDRWRAKTNTPHDCSTKIIRGMASGQFVPFYQPRWDASCSQPVAAEAKLRWRNLGEGLFASEAFMHVAQSTFLLDELMLGVLGQVASNCSSWRRRGCDLRVSMDVPLGFLTTSLPRRLEELFTSRNCSPEQLTLEVSEADWLQVGEAVREVLTRLCMRGFGLAIGQFGTGYAGAKQLLNAPATEIKISSALVRAAPDDPAAAEAISSCVALAREFGAITIADGVETSRHLRTAFQLGCDRVQGSLMEPLMPVDEFERWIARPSPMAGAFHNADTTVPA